MIFSTALISAVVGICSCVSNLDILSTAGHSKVLPVANTNSNQYSTHDYLAVLKAKCEIDKHLLNDYEKQCCLKITGAKTLPAQAPFSIIKQNTNVLQFTNDMDESLFKVLLRYFADNRDSYEHVNDQFALDQKPLNLATRERDIVQCLKEKASCLEQLRSPLPCQQGGGMEDYKDAVKVDVQQPISIRLENENEVPMPEQGRDADRNEIARLSKELQNTVLRLMAEERKTTTLKAELEQRNNKLKAVENELEECSSLLTEAKRNLGKQEMSLTNCIAELNETQTEKKTSEQRLAELANENEQLRKDLERQSSMLNEKDGLLKKCADVEPKLISCEKRLEQCQSKTTVTDAEWKNKYVECSTSLNISEARLTKSEKSEADLRSINLKLNNTYSTCRKDFALQKDENDRLKDKIAQLTKQQKTMNDFNTNQGTQIGSLEKELNKCKSNYRDTQDAHVALKKEAVSQIESYNLLNERYRTQSDQTLSERRDKEQCLSKLKNIEEDYKKCAQRLEDERTKLKNATSRAEQCADEHSGCKRQLTVALMQSENCSSDTELAQWKKFFDDCDRERNGCKQSEIDLNGALKTMTEQKDSCQEKLASALKDGEQCQTTNKELRITLQNVSEAHSDVQAQMQGLTEQESDCKTKLSSATVNLMRCNSARGTCKGARDRCLEDMKKQGERLGSLEGANSDLEAAQAELSKKYEQCNQERLNATDAASSLNVTLLACQRKSADLLMQINAFKIEINQCLHAGKLTRSNMTEWQQMHENCEVKLNEATGEQRLLVIQVNELKSSLSSMSTDLDGCKGQLKLLSDQRKGMLIEIEQYQVTTGDLNGTATTCAQQLGKQAADAQQCQLADAITNRQLLECMASLGTCQKPVHACPPTTGHNSYWDVDLTIGHANVTSTEAVTGCVLASADWGNSGTMRTFCYKQNGRMLRVPDQDALLMAHDYTHDHDEKFLVEPSAYFVQSLGFDLSQYASDEDVCYYINPTTSVIPQLKHEKCNANTYHVMCWAPYGHGYDDFTVIDPDYDHMAPKCDSEQGNCPLDYLDLID